MRYLGGKQRLGPRIAGCVNTYGALYGAETYAEPFVGMGGVARHVTIPDRQLSDIHDDLIMFLRAIQDGWIPPTNVDRDFYHSLLKEDPSALRGFVGFACSFGGKWFGGFANDKTGTRNYAAEQAKDAVKLGCSLNGATIVRQSYLDIPNTDITYCDPPYAGTCGYNKTGGRFDSARFWEWVRTRTGVVLVSEYTGPDWMEVVWEKPVKSTIKIDAASGREKNNRIEKLFAKWPD